MTPGLAAENGDPMERLTRGHPILLWVKEDVCLVATGVLN